MARILIETYGCTLNQSDSELMRFALEQKGHSVDQGVCADPRKYDYVIENTCTVKSNTERKIIHRISELRYLGPRLIVAGCMAGANLDAIGKVAPNASLLSTSNAGRIAEEISLIVRNNAKASLCQLLTHRQACRSRLPVQHSGIRDSKDTYKRGLREQLLVLRDQARAGPAKQLLREAYP